MKKIYLTILLALSACTGNQAPVAIDATPGTQTVNQADLGFPCTAEDSRRGMCMKRNLK